MAIDDFIFGTLATDELRQAHIKRLRSGVTHNHARTPRDPLPGQPVTLDLTVGPPQTGGLPPLEKAWVYWTTDGSDPQGEAGNATRGQATEMWPVGLEWDTLVWGYVRRFRISLPGQPPGTVLRYRLSAVSLDEKEVFADGGVFYAYYIDKDPIPEWARRAVVYQVFVDRFHPGAGNKWKKPRKLSGFFGGTLQGVTEKLEYIRNLGADVLWLSPIFPSPTHHGYDTTDYFEIEPRLGTKEDMHDLLEEAHATGMRVLLDFVPNHLSNQHTAFQNAIASPRSPYREWFTFTQWPNQYESFFGVRSLPEINLRWPAAREHILDAASYWLDFGVDGYRLDYAIGPAPDFWADFRKVTRQMRPDCWTFGEVVDPPDAQLAFEGALDGCLDFILLEAFRQTFAFGRWDALRFASFLDRHEGYFPPDFSRPSFLDNHDMNRFLWAAEGDKRRLKLAALCQFTLSGPPVIYQGTEVGLSQQRDIRQGKRSIMEEARQPMPWGEKQDSQLLEFYRRLVAFRRSSPVLLSGIRKTLQAEQDLLVYSRQNQDETVVTLLNLGQAPRTVSVETTASVMALETEQTCALRNRGKHLEVELPPLSGAILA